ncbi:MAG TPA: hypothetical protein VK541_04960, partial [Pedobacter sp.]|nr:hypothetical protein [Pedobacter sp.]
METLLFERSFPVGKVVDFDPAKDHLFPLDFTAANRELTNDILDDTGLFSKWIADKLSASGCRYGIGGYAEHRAIYVRSTHF